MSTASQQQSANATPQTQQQQQASGSCGNDRIIDSVLFPPKHKLTLAEVFDPHTGKPRPDVLKQHFILEGRIEENAALRIIQDGP